MKEIIKKLARAILGDYSAYQIYESSSEQARMPEPQDRTTFRVLPVDALVISSSTELLIREQAGYAGPGAQAYACFDGSRMVGVCFFWSGSRYQSRNFWALKDGEAKLVQIVSVPDMRGHGVATMLIEQSRRDMMQRGFTKAYARVWHSNTPSLRAFDRAGWRRIALVLEINPFRQSRPWRIRIRLKPNVRTTDDAR